MRQTFVITPHTYREGWGIAELMSTDDLSINVFVLVVVILIDVLCPSQNFFSHVGTEPLLCSHIKASNIFTKMKPTCTKIAHSTTIATLLGKS